MRASETLEHGLGSGGKVSIEEIYDVIRQAVLGLAREVADVAKQDGDVELPLFQAGYNAQFLEVKDDNVLGALQQPARDDVAVNPRLNAVALLVVKPRQRSAK
jgi:hypothetical protein